MEGLGKDQMDPQVSAMMSKRRWYPDQEQSRSLIYNFGEMEGQWASEVGRLAYLRLPGLRKRRVDRVPEEPTSRGNHERPTNGGGHEATPPMPATLGEATRPHLAVFEVTLLREL